MLVSDEGEFSRLDPDYISQEVVISLVESGEVTDRNGLYMWYQLLTEDQHQDLFTKIRDVQDPFSIAICSYNSGPAQDHDTEIRNYLREYIEWRGFDQVDIQTEEPRVGRVLDFSQVRYAAHDEDRGTIAICGCDKNSDDVHLHYIIDEEIQSASKSDTAEKAASLMSESVGKLESLSQKTKDFTDREKIFAVIFSSIVVGPALPLILDVAGLNRSVDVTYPQVLQFGLLIVAVVFLVALVATPMRFQLHSLRIATRRRRLLRWLSGGADSLKQTARSNWKILLLM